LRLHAGLLVSGEHGLNPLHLFLCREVGAKRQGLDGL
jgi:hypothetical protein